MKRKTYLKISFFLIITMIMLCFSGCGKKESNENVSKKSSSTKKEETSTENNAYADLKIGVINIGASTDTSGYTFAHVNGIKGMMSSLGLKDDQVIYKDNIPDGEQDLDTIKKAIQECIDGGCKIIFATCFGLLMILKASNVNVKNFPKGKSTSMFFRLF